MDLILTDKQRDFLSNNPHLFVGKSVQEKLDILARVEHGDWSKRGKTAKLKSEVKE